MCRIHLSKNVICTQEQIMHKRPSIALTVLKQYINIHSENSMKLDIYYIRVYMDPYITVSKMGSF